MCAFSAKHDFGRVVQSFRLSVWPLMGGTSRFLIGGVSFVFKCQYLLMLGCPRIIRSWSPRVEISVAFYHDGASSRCRLSRNVRHGLVTFAPTPTRGTLLTFGPTFAPFSS